jgi:hypothetical protein
VDSDMFKQTEKHPMTLWIILQDNRTPTSASSHCREAMELTVLPVAQVCTPDQETPQEER